MAILALADIIVVTSDSVSMISEAAATGKPVRLFDLDPGPAGAESGATADFRPSALLYRLMMRAAPQRLTRDLTLFHDRMISGGHCGWLDSTAAPQAGGSTGDMERAIARVRGLLGRRP